ncbi:DUF6375 family protein [Rhodanobacter terrae]|uniref:DUF6375 family protein n=1 Tax=Rhodanobacter terrae TaxID=418647 RepID=A0ABW0T2Y2_9GAMM
MKIWNGYGSEHSMNLVLIGRFKRARDAEKVEKDIDKLSTQASRDDSQSIPFGEPEDQKFSDDMLSLLRSEPPRDLRRLQLLREWSHEQVHEVFP